MGLLSERQVLDFVMNFQKGYNAMKDKPAKDLMFGMLISAATNEINNIIKKELEKKK